MRAPMGGVKPLPYFKGWPTPALSGAPDRSCTTTALALRLSRAPLSNHPNEPLAPVEAVEQWSSGAMEL